MEKKHARREKLAERDKIPPDQRIAFNESINRYLQSVLIIDQGTVIAGYDAIRSEANIAPSLAAFGASGAKIALPVVLDQQTIVFRHWLPETPLIKGAFGAHVPSETGPVLDPDIILLPLAAFDKKGNRLGYGAGYYDRAIASLRAAHKSPRLIGIAFECQRVETIAAEAHDVPLDAVITEKGAVFFEKPRI